MSICRGALHVALGFQLAACGTIMYPERKGQTGGRIDPGVAVLDGLCLLLFIVPGVIAFMVDFDNGTIYLPGASRSSWDPKDMRRVKFDPTRRSLASVEATVKTETGVDVRLDRPDVRVARLPAPPGASASR